MEKALSSAFNYEAYLFIKSTKQIKEILENIPFTKDNDKHIYCFLTEKNFERNLLKAFENTIPLEGEHAVVCQKTFFWQVPKGETLSSEFSKILGKKSFKNKCTSRNIQTLEKVLKKM